MSLTRVPDHFNVWAFADPHGIRSGLTTALREAGLTDGDDRWIAPAETALVGCGDYIDRGTDSAGMLDLMFRLRAEAAVTGSLVVLCWGNHEAMLDGVLRGYGEDAATWLSGFAGGEATARSLGVSPWALRSLSARSLAGEVLEEHPELPGRLAALVDAVIWRDVLFCHAGPVADYGPADLGVKTHDHLWQVPAFYRSGQREFDLAGPGFASYRAAGIERYVFGHESHSGPEVFQGGAAIGLDTNTSGGAFGIDVAYATLVRIPSSGSLLATTCVLVDTSDAPDRPRF